MHTFPNEKKYVGITCRTTMNRWGSDGRKYKGQMVYKAIQKYGWDNINHEIIYSNLTKQEACKKEKELILKYHTWTGDEQCNGYNMSLGGEQGAYGVIRKEETKQKMRDSFTPERRKMLSEKAKTQDHIVTESMRKAISEANRHRVWTKEMRENHSNIMKKNKICQYNLDGLFIKKWESARDIEKETGWYATSIIGVCKGKIKTYKGYVWRYDSDDFDMFDHKPVPSNKPVLQYDLFGKFLHKYESATEASKVFDCEVSCIANCCNGLNVSSFNFIWFYEDEFSEEKLNSILNSFENIYGFKQFYWFMPVKKLIESGKTRQETAKELNLQWQFVNRISKMKYLDYSISQ